jgi:hypothetical protein
MIHIFSFFITINIFESIISQLSCKNNFSEMSFNNDNFMYLLAVCELLLHFALNVYIFLSASYVELFIFSELNVIS